ncbi:MAG: nucleotidyltransferase substrate binding protein [Lentisphaerae bacterium]|nr:nucleotidyltransferase substrate binding protein [Lentisphaerota bacterium]
MDSSTLLKDLGKAVDQFEAALALDANNDVLKAGCIQYFEFCFELAWKTIKSCAQDEGLMECNSPKSALRQAFASGWIDDEEAWLNILSVRNQMSHTYSANEALKVFDALPGHLKAFKALVVTLQALRA